MAKSKKLPKFVKLVIPKKTVKPKFDVKAFAEAEAKAVAGANDLGSFIEAVQEDEIVTTYLWEANRPGYVGWRWSVSVAQLDPATEPTLTEVVLVPGPDSLVAPAWIPWSERLADYQALQAELAKQAQDEAQEESQEEAEEEAELEVAEEEGLPVLDAEQSEDTKQ